MTGMIDHPLPGIPLIESPLFAQLLPAMGLSAEEERVARDLNRDGFAVLDFPDADLDARIARIQARLGPRYGVDLADPAADKTGGERRVQDAWRDDNDVRAIAANPAMLDLLHKLYGRPAFPFQTLNFPVGTQQGAHSDSVHFSSLPERFMCGVWLAMEDIGADAGPLFYVPGSHRWPVLNNAMIGRQGAGSALASAQDPYADAWAALCTAHGTATQTFLAKKGQALIWCANLLHGGSPQHDPRLTRWSQVTHYYFDDCIYYTPAFSDEAIGQLQLRAPVNVADGRPRPGRYLGQPVPAHLDARATARRLRGVMRRLSRALRPAG
jgi:hypothetical protein